VIHNAALMLGMLFLSEIILGVALVLGVARKLVYYFGVPYSLILWGLSGFGGPYTPYSSDLGAPVMYAFVFLALIALELETGRAASRFLSFDAIIERHLSKWKKLAEFSQSQA